MNARPERLGGRARDAVEAAAYAALTQEPHPEAVVLSGDTYETPSGRSDADPVRFDEDEPATVHVSGEALPAHTTGRLAVNAVAGGAANFLKIGIQLVMLPLMAHLLGPTEFGLYALALPTVAFFMALADGGLGASLARESESATVVWSTAFWLLLAVGVALAAIVSGWGVVLAILAHEPAVSGLMSFLSPSFILITAAVLPSARLTRQGRLVVFAGADLSSAIVGAVVAVTLAAAGWGAKSLAAQYVTSYLVRAVILNAVAFVRPTLEFKLSSLRHHLSTGSSLLASRLSDFAGRLMENLFYGRSFGAAALGLYTFANQAPRFVCEAASGPIWGALYAHALREDEERVAALHVKLVRLLASVVFPVAFLLSATAPEIFSFILGSKWNAASTLLRILIPFYALHVVAAQSGAIFLAKGRGWLLFWLTFILTAARVCAVFLGPLVGQIGVAYGIGVAEALYAVLMFGAPSWNKGSSPAPMLKGLVAPILSGALAAVYCYWVVHLRAPSPASVALGVIGGTCAYLALMLLLQRKALLNDLDVIRRMLLRARVR